MRTLAVVVVGLLIAAAIAWDAGERHYDNCVAHAKTINPGNATGSIWDRDPGDPTGAEAQRERRNAIAGCSRTP